jgi:hypothetical protein
LTQFYNFGLKIYEPSSYSKVLIWAQKLVKLMLPLGVMILDIVLDSILVCSYWAEYKGGQLEKLNLF